MKIITEANETVLKILKNFKKTAEKNRLLHFCIAEPVDDGVLLFNLLTREMVHLSEQEYVGCLEDAYLKDRWFVVPENTNEKAYVDFVRTFLKRQAKPDGSITSYTIFPTTDCNARCFYCFELGRSRIPMSKETAKKVAQYIITHCGGKTVKISWFGGEPLYNSEAIDIICDDLCRAGVEYKSAMVSNGYLFDDATVQKSVDFWKLKRIQITLDGTEKVYNKIKAFIYRDTNPYQIVLDNIERLLDASVTVSIRLNMDLANAADLVTLVEQLAGRFANRHNLSVYAHHLFKGNEALANSYSEKEWLEREEAMERLEQAIKQGGFAQRKGVVKALKLNHCMADNDKAVTILPDGSIGKCEHHSESEFVGHIEQDTFDQEMVNSWKEKIAEIPECATCFHYPECFMLKKCSNQNVCFLQHRQRKERIIRHQMHVQYEHWLNQLTEETDDEEFD